MSENQGRRVGRLVSGGFNALVDAIENAAPETVMEEAIREIDDAIDDVRAELGKVIANKHLASTRLMEENRRHGDLDDKVRLAVDQARDDLAEAAIAKQMDIEAQIPVLEAAITDAGNQERELGGYVQALQAKKREMENELASYRSSRADAVATGGAADRAAGTSTVDSKVRRASDAFGRVMGRATGLPGQASGDRKSAAQLAERDEQSRGNRVKERLAQLKSESKKE
jgi:phage shock protein A